MNRRRQVYKKERTFDHELTLISQRMDFDEIGNQIPVETKKIILCDLNSIGQQEFYNASVQGLKPSIVFVVHPFEYEGEALVEFESQRYKVIRTYGIGTDELELTCERVNASV